MWLNVVCGFATGFVVACIGYFKNMRFSRLCNRNTSLCDEKSIAVLIATRNEEHVIENTIRTLLAEAPPSLRVIVVDESSDATFSILERLSTEFSNLVVIRHEGPPGKPAALNTALDHVTEEIVLFLDADARFPWATIRKYVSAFSDPAVNAVFANCTPYNVKRTLAVILQDVYFSFAKAFVFSGLFANPIFMNSGFFLRREVLDAVGKFDTKTIVDDFDLWLRMGRKGYKARFVHGPKCEIQYAFRVKEMFKQHCRWDTGWIRKLFEQRGRRRMGSMFTLGGLSTLVFFPHIALLLGYGLHLPVFLYTVIPVFMSIAYAAALLAYLFYDVKNWREALFNACLGMFMVYALLQLTILVSFIKAFQARHTWYKVTREQH